MVARYLEAVMWAYKYTVAQAKRFISHTPESELEEILDSFTENARSSFYWD